MALFNKRVLTIDDDLRGRIRIFATDPGCSRRIRDGIRDGFIEYTSYTVRDGERLDVIAGRMYGDSSQWRVIAAANGIGWALQVKAGTALIVPTDLVQVYDTI